METESHKKTQRHVQHEDLFKPTPLLLVLGGLLVALLLFNQFQVTSLQGSIAQLGRTARGSGNIDLAAVNVMELKSTAQVLNAVFPVETIKTQDDALAVLFPTGTPDYGGPDGLGVSYDDPVGSLEKLARMYEPLKQEVKTTNPEAWDRFINLATRPVGISCEYCCGIGPVGVSSNGESRCGCQHNPALLSVALYLTAYTDYSDAEILQEVMKWKTLFFPKNMIELGLQLGGGDTAVLEDLPGMVGGC